MFHIPAHKNVAHPAGQVSGAPTKPLLNVLLGHCGPIVEIIDIPAAKPIGPDFSVSNHGSIYLLTPLTGAAEEWVDEHIGDDALRFGYGVSVEHRYIRDIVDGIVNDGLTVE